MSQSGCCASSPSPAPSPSAQNGREVRLKQYGVAETDAKGKYVKFHRGQAENESFFAKMQRFLPYSWVIKHSAPANFIIFGGTIKTFHTGPARCIGQIGPKEASEEVQFSHFGRFGFCRLVYSREFLVKVVLLGDSGVGKTSIMRRFVDNSYSDDFKPTIGVDFATKEVTVKDASVKLQIWDTAGQERFRAIAGTYYRGASAALVVFDATNENSFQSVSRWVNEVFNSANTDGRNVIICIVANKCDLTEARQVSAEKVRDFITSNEIKAKFVEVSAKENQGIQEIFTEIAEALAAGRHALSQ